MQNTTWLSWWIWHGVGKSNWGLDLNEEPMEGNDVNDQPTPIIKLYQAREYAQLLSNFAMEHPLEFSVVDVMSM